MKSIPDIDSPLLFPSNSFEPEKSGPDFSIERHFLDQGLKHIAGTDEVGRGPLAGPVVAASVILDPNNLPMGLNDSKKLTPASREKLCEKITASSHVCVSSIPPSIIDRINIRQASLLAMQKSCNGLSIRSDILMVDGRDCPTDLDCTAQAFIKGDARSITIAAASIVAKVIRDRQMTFAAQLYPEYGFEKHKGYGSKAHLTAISKHGPCPLHRLSFSPMKSMA